MRRGVPTLSPPEFPCPAGSDSVLHPTTPHALPDASLIFRLDCCSLIRSSGFQSCLYKASSVLIHLIGCCGSSSQKLPVAAQLGKIRIPTAPCDRHLPGILPPSFPTNVLQLHQPSCSFLNMLSSFPPQDLCTCCSFSFDCSSSTFLQDCLPHFIQVFVRCHLFRKDICDDFIYLCTHP